LERFDAVRLFVARARRARPHFELTQDNAAAVARICQRLDGIPLAIELAAARVRVLPPQQMADGLADSFQLLGGGARSALPRQRTLEASIEWSYRLLVPDEQRLLDRLSVFAGGFTLEAAEAVCSGDDMERYVVLDVLTRLVDKSLVCVEEDGPAARYRLLETVRDHARRRLIDSGAAPEVFDRHLEFFLGLAESLEPELEGWGAFDTIEVLSRDYDNVRTALDWGIQAGRGDQACRFVGRLRLFWPSRGHISDALRLADNVLALPDAGAAARLQALEARGDFLSYLGDTVAAEENSREALALAQDTGARRWVGRALNQLGWNATWTRRPSAQGLLEEAIEINREEGDLWYLSDSLTALSNLMLYLGRPTEARRFCEEAENVARSAGNRTGITRALYFLGWAGYLEGDLSQADDDLARSVDVGREFGDPFWLALALETHGAVAAVRGDEGSAERLLLEGLSIGRDVGNPFAVGLALAHLGEFELARGNVDAAADRFTEALPALTAIGLDWVAAFAQSGLGDVAEARGDLAGAAAAWEAALAIATEADNLLSVAHVELRRARAARWGGDLRRAEDFVHDALASYLERGSRTGVVDAFEGLAELAADHESWAEAARLLGASDVAREALGYARPALCVERCTRLTEVLRAQLGDEALDVALAEGGQLSIDDAVTYARKRRGSRKRPSTGWASLTPMEIEVARLVAEGLTNPQIAERLFITRGTVKVHLSHIFGKLGIAHRAELASAIARRDANS
jgi:DNA-binding CsgD family transcriptional regulator/predicted negative regulator of RcsB-dependent stress response